MPLLAVTSLMILSVHHMSAVQVKTWLYINILEYIENLFIKTLLTLQL